MIPYPIALVGAIILLCVINVAVNIFIIHRINKNKEQ